MIFLYPLLILVLIGSKHFFRAGITVSLDELIVGSSANTAATGWCILWLKDWIQVAGHKGPTGSDVFYCEGIEKRQLHDEYLLSFMDPTLADVKQTKPLRYSAFRKILAESFGHVRFLSYQNVALKCDTCAKLTSARRGSRSKEEKTAIAILHMLHRVTYMAERHAYYLRQIYAMENSKTVWSFIFDGMQQDHCNLPHRGNAKEFSDRLPQHIQGVLTHCREIVLCRTFHNYGGPANLTVHSFLLALERRFKFEECNPETLFVQMDGGGENRGHLVPTLCEYLVRTRFVTDKIVLSRLPAGISSSTIGFNYSRTQTVQVTLTKVTTLSSLYCLTFMLSRSSLLLS
jgi:hypothetical protein